MHEGRGLAAIKGAIVSCLGAVTGRPALGSTYFTTRTVRGVGGGGRALLLMFSGPELLLRSKDSGLGTAPVEAPIGVHSDFSGGATVIALGQGGPQGAFVTMGGARQQGSIVDRGPALACGLWGPVRRYRAPVSTGGAAMVSLF